MHFSIYLKARLSNIVEAEPDCTAAMDILGFALYHENKQTQDTTYEADELDSMNAPKRPLTPDSSIEGMEDEDDNESAVTSKKRRFGGEDSDPRNDLKYRIWDDICKGDGDLPIDSLCPDVTDRDEVIAAVSEMEGEGRVMISDGNVYQID